MDLNDFQEFPLLGEDLYYNEAMICKISPSVRLTFASFAKLGSQSALSSVRIKLLFYYPWGSRPRATTPSSVFPFQR